MKKTITIILAICAFIASVATNIYYICDENPETKPDVQQVIEKAKDVKDAIVEQQPAENK